MTILQEFALREGWVAGDLPWLLGTFLRRADGDLGADFVVGLAAVYSAIAGLPGDYATGIAAAVTRELCAWIDSLSVDASYSFETYLATVAAASHSPQPAPQTYRVRHPVPVRTWRELEYYRSATAPLRDYPPDSTLCGLWVPLATGLAVNVRAVNASPRPAFHARLVRYTQALGTQLLGTQPLAEQLFRFGESITFHHDGTDYVVDLEARDE